MRAALFLRKHRCRGGGFLVAAGVDLVARVLRFEEVDELEDVGRGRHPLGGVGRVVVLVEAELGEASVGDVLHVLVHVISVETEDAAREEVFVEGRLEVDAFNDDVADLVGEFRRHEFGVFLKDDVDQVDAEFEVQ